MTFDKKRIFSLIGGALFVCLGILRIYYIVSLGLSKTDINTNYILLFAESLVNISLGVLLFLKKQNLMVAYSLIALLALGVAQAIVLAVEIAPEELIFSADDVVLEFVGDFVAVLYLLIQKNKIKTKLLCFIPFVIQLLLSMANSGLNIASLPPYLFLALWMTTLILPETEDAPISESLFGDADRIEEYKRLLDDGVITEEEYERIKRQILSLK